MTRINVVPPSELSNKHLVAEYRELPRVYALAHAAWKRGERPNDPRNPTEYCLGTGHVRFFYPRLYWLIERHCALVREMLRRGFKVNFPAPPDFVWEIPSWFGWSPEYDYTPTPADLALNLARIKERTK